MTLSPFSLLLELYPSAPMQELLTTQRTVDRWVAFEHALAGAQAAEGVISKEDAEAIREIGVERVDLEELWTSARNVGYPILGLVRQMAARAPVGPNGRIHYGATTQDTMDTAQAMLLREAGEVLQGQLQAAGNRLASIVERHSETVMPGRTHGQQAVPTTFGAQMAPILSEMTRNRDRLKAAVAEAGVVSLFGAGGTSAALGPKTPELRARMAVELGLGVTDVPWHTARDRIVSTAHVCVLIVGSCARLARNAVDLSRTEIGEVGEAAGDHRGASSTMPQKANPILSEGIIGISGLVGPLASSLSRTLEMPQERAAGEWQIEWHAVPQILQLTSSALAATEDLLAGLRANAQTMLDNLQSDGGLIMSEAAMISLAAALGRENAHDVVYGAVQAVRAGNLTLKEAIEHELEQRGHQDVVTIPAAVDYVGEARAFCKTAVREWFSAQEVAS